MSSDDLLREVRDLLIEIEKKLIESMKMGTPVWKYTVGTLSIKIIELVRKIDGVNIRV